MTPYTLQTAFNKIWQTFVVEKAPPSRRGYGDGIGYQCSYGAPGTPGCAIGCLLTPAHQQMAYAWEQGASIPSGVGTMLRYFTFEELSEIPLSQLSKLQTIHDVCSDDLDKVIVDRATQRRFTALMERDLQDFAQTHDLVIPS
jgi:hypothetical protein